MKKNINGEMIALIIVTLIVIIGAVFFVYTVYISDNSFYDNANTNTDNSKTEENNDNIKNDSNPLPIETQKPVETEISAFTSSIYDNEQGRIHNITLAMQKLNGHIVKKGEEFSFNNTIGPMGKEQGYEQALGFDNKGNKIKIYGGGMCQVSSTLYNSVLMAGLEVTERHAHSRRVYYVPKDRDATIFYPKVDFKFKNNSDGDIKIVASNDNANVTIKLIKITNN